MLHSAPQSASAAPVPLQRCPTCGRRARGRECEHDGTELVALSRDALLGEVLGGAYRVAAPLARGGMGRLYRARHVRLDRDVAVKVLSPDFAENELALARFFREVEALARIRSQNVVRVLDALQTPDGRPCIVTELLEGEDLQKRVSRQGTLPLGEALSIAQELTEALMAVHAEGVLHRDLKPSNVFLCDDEQVRVRLLDFGVARLEEEGQLTRTGAVVGTPAYMAPEQVRGAVHADVRADVYGVGAILYRALTGHPPYSSGPAVTVLSAVLEGAPVAPSVHQPEMPLDIEALILRAMARKADQRFESAEALLEALRPLVQKYQAPTVAASMPGRHAHYVAASVCAGSFGLAAAAEATGDASLAVLGLGTCAFAWRLAKLPARWLNAGMYGVGGFYLAFGLVTALTAAGAPESLRVLAPLVGGVVAMAQWMRSKTSSPSRATQAECTASTMIPSSSERVPASQRTPARARS
ncbi:MAG: serine/threonine-protein kinase [Polyangiales bacterium]